MTRSAGVLAGSALVAAILAWAGPSVFPTGTTIYDPSQAWSGYTILSPLNGDAAIVIDMNGVVVKRWEGFNSSAGGPMRVLPGGVAIGAAGANPGKQESLALVARDFDGKELWRFDRNERIKAPDGAMIWSLRQHHDWQREDFPSGYYSPSVTPAAPPNGPARTLLLTHTNHARPPVAKETILEDDRLIELGADGEVTWEWVAGDHIEDFHFDDAAREAIRNGVAERGAFDWFHMNSATYVGPNHWYDDGDKRFAPENVLISSRQASLLAIVARDGKIVWQMGPDYGATPELRAIRQVIGQHHAHFIPKGLPGAGNLMVFDNGGASVYGRPNANAPQGQNIYARPASRVLEIDPVALKLAWSYTSPAFFASNISGAQRLANGNTLITEGPDGRLFEVTKDGAIVWEYVYPVFGGVNARKTNSVYRAYRVPYAWIPQIPKPAEKAVIPPKAEDFRVKAD